MIDITGTPGENVSARLREALSRDSVRIIGDFVSRQQKVPSDRVVRGRSRDLDKLTRLNAEGAGSVQFDANGEKKVAFSDLHMELDPRQDYTTGISVRDGKNIRIERMRFTAPYGSPDATPITTLMAILAKGAKNVAINDILLDGCQIKVNGGSRDVRVRNVESHKAQNFGISCVTDRGAVPQITRNVLIEGTAEKPILVENPDNGGIYVGADSDEGHGGLHNCTVRHAIIRTGTRLETPFGFIARIGTEASHWDFAHMTIEPTDPRRPPSSAFNVKSIDVQYEWQLDQHGEPLLDANGRKIPKLDANGQRIVTRRPGPMQGLLVNDVHGRGSDHADINLEMHGGWATIQFSSASGGRGIRIRGHGVVTIAHCESNPRADRRGIVLPALEMVGDWGGRLRVSSISCTLNGPVVKQGDVIYDAS